MLPSMKETSVGSYPIMSNIEIRIEVNPMFHLKLLSNMRESARIVLVITTIC